MARSPVNLRMTLVIALLVTLVIGCGSSASKSRAPMAKVRGKVVFQGKPVVGANVVFQKDKAPRASTGTTNNNGEFTLTTFDKNDGAFVGMNKVSIVEIDPAPVKMSGEDLATKGPPPPFKGILPAKYADLKTTTIEKEVAAKSNDIPIELTE